MTEHTPRRPRPVHRLAWRMWLLASVATAHAGVHATEALPAGTALPPAAQARYAITIYPDGRHLPPGTGTPQQGRVLFAQRCASCHGPSGIEGPAARLVGSDGFWSWRQPLRPLRIIRYPLLVNSVGAQWPYATTIFDYIRRAMPHHAPKSLSADEVYALSAFILRANDLIAEDATMTATTLPRVVMPGKARSVDASSTPPKAQPDQAPAPQ